VDLGENPHSLVVSKERSLDSPTPLSPTFAAPQSYWSHFRGLSCLRDLPLVVFCLETLPLGQLCLSLEVSVYKNGSHT
jgi:hypothetical protein